MSLHVLLNAVTINRHGYEQKQQALVIENDRFVWCGKTEELPSSYLKEPHAIVEDCSTHVITPALIDCHTHLVYGGHRAREFRWRLQGLSYTDIAKQGGGILSTVEATRDASEELLLSLALPRLLAMKAEGVLTVEIKSGYGLNLETELKMLRVARALGKQAGVQVRTTFLGAHVLAPEYKNNPQAYIDYVCNEMLPVVAESGLADAVDIFCESIAFNLAQAEQLFKKAQLYQLPIKCHAEQLSLMGATLMAAKYKALSCDHLEYLDEQGVKAMAESGSMAVILPGAYYFLKETRKPPIDLLRAYGVGLALATDCNPGTSPTTSLLLMANMACLWFGFTVEQALSAITYQAACALGLADEIGELAVGKRADLVCWFIDDAAQLCYSFGMPIAHRTMQAGQWVS